MNKHLFIDIDCIAQMVPQNAPDAIPIAFCKSVFQFLARIKNELDFELILLKRDATQDQFVSFVLQFCKNEHIVFAEIVDASDVIKRFKIDTSTKPRLVCSSSYPQPERLDAEIFYLDGQEDNSSPYRTWAEIYKVLLSQPRLATITRKTSETDIQCSVNLDGSGVNEIATGLAFFDHMLQQIARHGNLDLSIKVKGDLHIDEHHTIEDVGLALGAAFYEALGNKKGIERYGFLLPMDDCLAQVALDFGGRPWLVWEAEFKREKIGDVPTEMFIHFFKSFSDTAKCNLNIKAEGSNEHHKIESIFKAFAKSIHMAITKNDNNAIPSTKGSL